MKINFPKLLTVLATGFLISCNQENIQNFEPSSQADSQKGGIRFSIPTKALNLTIASLSIRVTGADMDPVFTKIINPSLDADSEDTITTTLNVPVGTERTFKVQVLGTNPGQGFVGIETADVEEAGGDVFIDLSYLNFVGDPVSDFVDTQSNVEPDIVSVEFVPDVVADARKVVFKINLNQPVFTREVSAFIFLDNDANIATGNADILTNELDSITVGSDMGVDRYIQLLPHPQITNQVIASLFEGDGSAFTTTVAGNVIAQWEQDGSLTVFFDYELAKEFFHDKGTFNVVTGIFDGESETEAVDAAVDTDLAFYDLRSLFGEGELD